MRHINSRFTFTRDTPTCLEGHNWQYPEGTYVAKPHRAHCALCGLFLILQNENWHTDRIIISEWP